MTKKVSELTPFEKVERKLVGMTNEEVEDVTVRIMAQLVAKHVYAIKDGDEYVKNLMKKILVATDEYAKKHSFELACASVFAKRGNVK